MENWRKYINEGEVISEWGSRHEPAGGHKPMPGEFSPLIDREREVDVDYNLFYDYIQNDLVDSERPDLVEYVQNYHKYITFPGWFRGSGKEWLEHAGIPHKGWDQHNKAIPAWNRLKDEVKKRMDKEWKWDFPHDVDPEMRCNDKLRYLDELVYRFLKSDGSREMSDTSKWRYKQDSALTVTEGEGDISPYRKCKSELRGEKEDLKSKTAAEEEMEPYELSPELEKE